MKQVLKSLVLAATLAACGPRAGEEMSGSDLDFIMSQQNSFALSAKVKQPKITIGLAGPYNSIRGQLEKDLESIVLKWIEPMRALSSEPLASRVEFVESETNVDAVVEIVPGVHAHTFIQDTPLVRIDASGYFGSYNVVLHEFGHAFALLDTYQGGQSGNCQPGQPQAVMCNTSFSDLQADDIKGVQAIFKSGFPGDRPAANPQGEIQINIAVADRENALLLAATSSGKLLTGTMEYCLDDDCTSAESSWQTAKGSAGIYTTENITIKAGSSLTVRFSRESKVTSRRIQISAR